MTTRGLSTRCLRSISRRLALEPPGWLFSISGPDRDLIVRRELAVTDPELLLGLRADGDWRAVALLLPGHTDVLPGHTDGDEAGGATLSFVADRRGRSALAVQLGDEPDEVESMSESSGLLADIARRMFGLASHPEPVSSAQLVISVWLQNLLDATAEPAASGGVLTWTDAVGQHPAWRAGGGPFQIPGDDGPHRPDDLAELTTGLARHLTWERLRRLAADGAIVIPGLAASEAAWMDWPFFARWTLGVHRPVTELLDDLSLFIDGGVLRDVRYTVDAVGWLGFADSHAS